MDNRRKGKKSNIQLDGRIIAYCVVILFTVLLPVLGLPSFRAEKTSTASGIISNISAVVNRIIGIEIEFAVNFKQNFAKLVSKYIFKGVLAGDIKSLGIKYSVLFNLG